MEENVLKMLQVIQTIQSDVDLIKNKLFCNEIDKQDDSIEICNTVKKMIQDELTYSSYKTWFENISLKVINDTTTVFLPTDMHLHMFEERYGTLLKTTLNNVLKKETDIVYLIKERE